MVESRQRAKPVVIGPSGALYTFVSTSRTQQVAEESESEVQ